MKKIFILLTLFSVVFFSSCSKFDNDPIDPTSANNSIDELTIPSDFEWETTNDIDFSFQGFTNAYIKVLSQDGTEYLKANLKKNEIFNTRYAIPSYERTLILKYLDRTVEVDIVNGTMSYHFSE